MRFFNLFNSTVPKKFVKKTSEKDQYETLQCYKLTVADYTGGKLDEYLKESTIFYGTEEFFEHLFNEASSYNLQAIVRRAIDTKKFGFKFYLEDLGSLCDIQIKFYNVKWSEKLKSFVQ